MRDACVEEIQANVKLSYGAMSRVLKFNNQNQRVGDILNMDDIAVE